jgi:hypothetical protein
MAEPNIHDYPWLLEATGIDVNKLGCVMLPVQFLKGLLTAGYASGELSEDDLYFAANPDHYWIKGDISGKAHVTVLYGLLKPAYEQQDLIERLFDEGLPNGFPDWLPLTGFEIFPSPMDDEAYGCIVARIGDPSGVIAHAHQLLQYLPNVSTFASWKLHATIAYVKVEEADKWLAYLSGQPQSMVIVPDGPLDFGSNRTTK